MKKVFFILAISFVTLLLNAQTKTYSPNDANLDGEVNISDVNCVISEMCGTASTRKILPVDSLITLLKTIDNDVAATVAKRLGVEDSTVTPTPSDTCEYVDLGLSVKWAKVNVGATNIYDYGDYFAWGETIGYNGGKTDFINTTYKYYVNKGTKTEPIGYTKYVRSSDSSNGYDGFYDDKTTLESIDDAATANMGGEWRMPTNSEWSELCYNCTWEWVTINSVNGYKVTASNGNYIFLPAAGLHENTNLYYVDSYGFYWSNSLGGKHSEEASHIVLNPYGRSICDTYRYHGSSVRAVRSE